MKGFTYLLVFVAMHISCTKLNESSDPTSLHWSECHGEAYESINLAVTCARFKVPLHWEAKDKKESIELNLAKIISRKAKPKGQIWMLSGGPGDPSAEMLKRAALLHPNLGDDFEFFILDLRGTNQSTPLICNSGEELLSCINRIKKTKIFNYLEAFSTWSGAKDLAHAIRLTHEEKHEVYVFGGSFGTYLLNRFLQIEPSLVTGAIMDSVCDSNLCRIVTRAPNLNTVGLEFLASCEQDSSCRARFSKYGNPTKAAEEILASFDNINNTNSCGSKLNIEREDFNSTLGRFIQVENAGPPAAGRTLIAPVLLRMMRCNLEDQKALEFMYKKAKTGRGGNPPIIFAHMGLSELFFGPSNSPIPSEQELNTLSTESVFSSYMAPSMHKLYEKWPRYQPNKAFYAKYATPKMPVLILDGKFDQDTPISWAENTYNNYVNNGSTKPTFVEIPLASHGTLTTSPVIDKKETCGIQLITSFILSGTKSIDRSCLKKLKPIDYAGKTAETKNLADIWFNTSNVWGTETP